MLEIFANINDLEGTIASLSLRIVGVAAVILVVLVILSILFKNTTSAKLKVALYGSLAATLVLPTIFLIVSTIYLNVKSESGGPVHWHAEIEFWACGSELELRDPTGFLSNKIGSSTYHEHNDKHIHLEGVVVRKSYDASLGKFLTVTGGYLNETGAGVALNEDEATWLTNGDALDGDGQGDLTSDELKELVTYSGEGPVAELKNGSECGGEPAQLQTFAYSYDEASNTYSQRKITDADSYVIRDKSSLGPPADCIIMEFDAEKDRTDKLCEQYGIRDGQRCSTFGVKEFTPDLCYAREVASGGDQ